MEAQKKGLSLKQKKSEKQCLEKRSPLQNPNLHKSNIKITPDPSYAAPVSAEARNGCLRFSLSSNSSSVAALSSSSSRTRLERKPRSLPKVGNNFSVKSFRSKENELPRKPFSEKSKKKKKQLCVEGRGNGKSKTDSVSKTAHISKLSCDRGNSVKVRKKGSKELKSSLENGSSEPPFKSSIPLGSSGVRRNAAEESGSRTANGGKNSATSVKTPPVEVSVSPEIQSKMAVSKSAATPVCYGAGHLLSGVTDKRKCRRTGSLRGGCEKVNLFDDEQNEKNVVDDLQGSLIHLPSEASVRWLLSQFNEGGEDQGSDLENKLEECEISCGNESLALDLLSLPSMLCGNVCELGCENSDFRGSGSVDDATNLRKAVIFMLSPQENSDEKMCDSLLAATPNSIFNSNSVSLGEGNSSAVSLGSLSSGNIIQTPSSDCSSYECLGRSNVEVDHTSFVQFELDSITESLDAVSLSSRCESFPYAGLDSSSHSNVPIQLKNNVDSVCSWESTSTLENLTLSQMRISWRDGAECRIDEHDEFDCCPCLSDEEINAFGCSDPQQLKPYQMAHLGRDDRNKQKEKDPWMDNGATPILLEYEPCILAAPNEKSTGDRVNACAESICSNGDDLAVSCDSDWANIQESHLFQVK